MSEKPTMVTSSRCIFCDLGIRRIMQDGRLVHTGRARVYDEQKFVVACDNPAAALETPHG